MRHDPKHPNLVNALIAAARSDPRTMEFLLDAPLDTAAILLGAHAFTVEAARAQLRVEQPELQEAGV